MPQFSTVVGQIFNGLTVGGVYALIALGYTMVYGIIELINFAHGEIYMIGCFISVLVLTVAVSVLPPWAALLIAGVCAMVISSAYGFTMEKIAYRPLRYAPRLSPLISAIGASYFLKEFVRLTAGFQFILPPVKVQEDPLIRATLKIGDIEIQFLQVLIILGSVAMMALLAYLVKRTPMGKAMRATAQDKTMAQLVGIEVDAVISYTFILAGSLAATAGTMIVLYYGSVDFNVGFLAGIKAFTAAVLGGIGNIPGAMLGGFVLGISEALFAGFVSSTYKDVLAFVILVGVLLVKPSGLLGAHLSQKA
ncbi:MAG: branched-chain amino acid ABC transporter permease [bacterium JZ-2024 1]